MRAAILRPSGEMTGIVTLAGADKASIGSGAIGPDDGIGGCDAAEAASETAPATSASSATITLCMNSAPPVSNLNQGGNCCKDDRRPPLRRSGASTPGTDARASLRASRADGGGQRAGRG